MHFNHTSLLALKHGKILLLAFQEVIDSGIFFNGKQNKLLEENLLNYLCKGFVTAVASGHDALLYALQSLNLQKDDEIIFPVNSYPTAFPIALSGAALVPVDVDNNAQLDVAKLQKAITDKTKAIITVHLYGLVGDIEAIQDICNTRKITLIEDCAQSFGSYFKNKPVGTFGDIGCFSFYPTKNIGTLGDGGALWTRHKKFYQFFQQAKSYGEKKRYNAELVSGHSRMPEIQAAILNTYFTNFPKEQEKKKNIYQLYVNYLSNKKLIPFIRIISSHADSKPLPHLFVIECKKRDKLQKYLQQKNIPTMIHYPIPIHLVKAFRYLGYKEGDFPTAEYLSKRILSLPLHARLEEKEIAHVTNSLQEFYA